MVARSDFGGLKKSKKSEILEKKSKKKQKFEKII